MKKNKTVILRRGFLSVSIAVCAACAVYVFTGCEPSTTDTNLAIEPAEVTLNSVNEGVVFTAIGARGGTVSGTSTNLFFPLEWSVTKPSLGTVAATGGRTAIYESTGVLGRNVLIVRDQRGAEGVALINQVAAPREDDDDGTNNAAMKR